MAIREQLKNRLTAYVKDTLKYIETVRYFCDQEKKWTSERKAELEKLRDINKNQKEENLDAVLKDTLKGLKKLEPFLDAVEKLTLTSRRVFSGKIFLLRGESPESVQSVINTARIVAPILIHFKRNAETFFQPLLHNVNVLIFQLNNYVLKTEDLCRIIRQSSDLSGDVYKHKTAQPVVELILDVSENAMIQMLDDLKQLCEIRMDQDTRLAFLFQGNAQKFIDVFSERRSRMWKSLSDLEETAVLLDRMKKGGRISTVAGSSAGFLGGALSIAGAIAGIILAPITAGLSLGVTLPGVILGGLSVANTLVTGVAEMAVNSHHEHNAQSYLNSCSDDIIKIEECLKQASNIETHLQPSAVDLTTLGPLPGELVEEIVNGLSAAETYKLAKSEQATAARAAAEIEMETVGEVSEVATNLSRTGQLAKTPTLAITKSVRVTSIFANVLFMALDVYFIVTESINLANGNETEVSKLIRSRAVLCKSELEAWQKIHDSLCIGIKTITESQNTLEKQFLL